MHAHVSSHIVAMNWSLLLISLWCLWLYRAHGMSGDSPQRFYLMIRENREEETGVALTLNACENATCLRRGEDNLECMCEDRYEKAERQRERCGDNGRNETSVGLLELRNHPDQLGICARAFAGLGYVVDINSNVTNSDNFTKSYTADELSVTISKLTNYSVDFWRLLDRTLVGVYLSSNQQRYICKEAYNEWLCSTSLSLYDASDGSEIKPCLDVCTRVVQQCPYYLPSKFQEQADNEMIYGGYPIFDCPDQQILEQYKKQCKQEDCSIPYSLASSDCIHRRNRDTSIHASSYLLLLLLSVTLRWIS